METWHGKRLERAVGWTGLASYYTYCIEEQVYVSLPYTHDYFLFFVLFSQVRVWIWVLMAGQMADSTVAGPIWASTLLYPIGLRRVRSRPGSRRRDSSKSSARCDPIHILDILKVSSM